MKAPLRIRFTGDMDESHCIAAIDRLNEEGVVVQEIDDAVIDIMTDVDDAVRMLRNWRMPFRVVEVE